MVHPVSASLKGCLLSQCLTHQLAAESEWFRRVYVNTYVGTHSDGTDIVCLRRRKSSQRGRLCEEIV